MPVIGGCVGRSPVSRVVFTTPEANEVMAQPVQILLRHGGKLPLGPGQPGISSLGAPGALVQLLLAHAEERGLLRMRHCDGRGAPYNNFESARGRDRAEGAEALCVVTRIGIGARTAAAGGAVKVSSTLEGGRSSPGITGYRMPQCAQPVRCR